MVNFAQLAFYAGLTSLSIYVVVGTVPATLKQIGESPKTGLFGYGDEVKTIIPPPPVSLPWYMIGTAIILIITLIGFRAPDINSAVDKCVTTCTTSSKATAWMIRVAVPIIFMLSSVYYYLTLTDHTDDWEKQVTILAIAFACYALLLWTIR